MDARCCCRAQSAMPQLYEIAAACVSGFGARKYFFWFHVPEAKSHCALTHNSFKVPFAAAATKMFLGVQADNRMAALPDTVRPRIASETDPVSQGPHANEPVKLSLGCGDACCHDISVIKN